MKHGEWQEASLAFRAALKQRPDAYDYAWLADGLQILHKPEESGAMRRYGLMLTLEQPTTVVPSPTPGKHLLVPFPMHKRWLHATQ